MNVKKKKQEEEDAINILPDELLCHMLSFLTTKEAALTSVLSKRWRFLFLLIPNLYLEDDERSEKYQRTSFMEFVNRVLALQSNSPINKFTLICNYGIDTNLVDDWILKVLKRGTLDLTLILLLPPCNYSLPCSIFLYGQNLIKLKLRCNYSLSCSIFHFKHSLFRGDFIFTKLRTLHLDSIELGLYGDGFSLLLSKCPLLEELIVNCIKWHHWSSSSISSSTLKRLTIDCEHYLRSMDRFLLRSHVNNLSSEEIGEPAFVSSNFGTANPHAVSFDTPNLVYLNYSDFVVCNYPLVKLDSLVEARLDLGLTIKQISVRDSDNYQDKWDATNLIVGIQNVQTLHLTSGTLEVIADFCKTIPIFFYLKHLSIESDDQRGWQALPRLLINSPNLQTLVFHGLHHRVSDGCGDACVCISPPNDNSFSCLSMCPVKILKILDFGATCGEMSLVEHFLKKLHKLEQMIIVLDLDSSLEEDLNVLDVYNALEVIPKASPNCKLKVVDVVHNC